MRAKIEIGAPGYVGGSLGAAVIGYSGFMTEYEAYETFMGRAPEPDEATQKRFEMGHQLEDFIAKQIEREYGVKCRKCNYAYIDPDHPWLICHPDRIATDKDGNVFPIEIKSASYFSSKKWGAEDSDEIPYSYLIQCYFYFHCKVPNSGYMWQITFSDNTLKRNIIKYDPEIEEAIFSRIIDTVENRWLKGLPPAPSSYSEATKMYSAPTEGAIEADAEILLTVKKLKDAQQKMKVLSEEEDRLKADIVEYMQDKEKLTYQGEKLMTYKRIEQSRFDSKSFRKDHPELADAYTTKSSYMKLA